MKIKMEITVRTEDGTTPMEQDVIDALVRNMGFLQLSWNDPSLGRVIFAHIEYINYLPPDCTETK